MSLPWTFMGVPTLSLFAGLDAHGLPHGLHVAGRYGTDHSMLARLEALETWMGPASIRNVLP